MEYSHVRQLAYANKTKFASTLLSARKIIPSINIAGLQSCRE